MKRSFGVKSRKERELAKKAEVKNQTISFTVSPRLKKEIEELKEMSGFESRSEFLRVCVAVNKVVMKNAKEGRNEMTLQKPGGLDRRYVYLKHILDLGEIND